MTGMDAQAGVNAFKNGEVDMVETGSQELIDQVKDVDGAVVYRAQQTANTILQVDSTKPQFEDVKVREAFFKAINIDQQKQIAWNGLGYEEDPAGSLTLFSFQPGYSDSMKPPAGSSMSRVPRSSSTRPAGRKAPTASREGRRQALRRVPDLG